MASTRHIASLPATTAVVTIFVLIMLVIWSQSDGEQDDNLLLILWARRIFKVPAMGQNQLGHANEDLSQESCANGADIKLKEIVQPSPATFLGDGVTISIVSATHDIKGALKEFRNETRQLVLVHASALWTGRFELKCLLCSFVAESSTRVTPDAAFNITKPKQQPQGVHFSNGGWRSAYNKQGELACWISEKARVWSDWREKPSLALSVHCLAPHGSGSIAESADNNSMPGFDLVGLFTPNGSHMDLFPEGTDNVRYLHAVETMDSKKSIEEREASRPTFSSCMGSPIVGDGQQVKLLAEWISVAHLMGSEKVRIYYMPGSTDEQVPSILAYWALKGLVDIYEWHVPNVSANYRGQKVYYVDCHSRSMDYTFVSFFDLDEFLVPTSPQHSTWAEALSPWINDTSIADFLIRNWFFLVQCPNLRPSAYPDVVTSLVTGKSSGPIGWTGRTKMILRTGTGFWLDVHHIGACPHGQREQRIPEDILFIRHYTNHLRVADCSRSAQKRARIVEDFGMWKYHTRVNKDVQAAFNFARLCSYQILVARGKSVKSDLIIR